MSIAIRTPYNWNAIASFLAKRSIRGVEAVDGDTYTRWVGPARCGTDNPVGPGRQDCRLRTEITVRFAKNTLVVSAQADGSRVRRLFDADAHPRTIAAHLSRDRTLAPLVATHRGIRVPGTWDPFELAVRAIVGQQISVAGATTILSRIAERYGEHGLFPKPDRLAEAAIDGMPRRRAETIRALAGMVARGEVRLERRGSLDETVDALRALPGIGPWTAHYIAMRLGEPDAFPSGDLGLRRALGDISERALERMSERWRPWRAYAAVLLWSSGQ